MRHNTDTNIILRNWYNIERKNYTSRTRQCLDLSFPSIFIYNQGTVRDHRYFLLIFLRVFLNGKVLDVIKLVKSYFPKPCIRSENPLKNIKKIISILFIDFFISLCSGIYVMFDHISCNPRQKLSSSFYLEGAKIIVWTRVAM